MRQRAFLALFLGLVLVLTARAQTTQTGSIRGVVTDPDGSALPGTAVTVTGPALIGTESTVTNQDGAYRIPTVPPGTYEVVAAIPGFRTIRRENVQVRVGMIVTINFEMAVETLKEEITVTAPSPAVDVVSTKTTSNVTKEVLTNIPMARDVYSALRLAPGTTNYSIKGGARNNHAFEVDGVNTNAPNQNYGEAYISWETVEEVEIITGGAGAEVFQGIGGMINVVTKSGGNKLSGEVQTYYTGEDFSRSVIPEEKLKAVGSNVPTAAVADYDLSGTLGGPILKDKLWFLANVRYQMNKRHSNFIPTTINGVAYNPYDLEMSYTYGFAKLTAQLTKNFRLFGMLTVAQRNTPVFDMAARRTIESNRWQVLDQITSSFNGTWTLNSNTFVEFRGGTWKGDGQNMHTKEAKPKGPYFIDRYTGYEWGRQSGQFFGFKRNAQTGAKATHFKDDFLGADHEIKAGLEIQWGSMRSFEPLDNGMTWDYYDGNPYYFRGLYGLSGPHPEYGDGRLTFTNAVSERGDPNKDSSLVRKTRLGLFVQDSFNIKSRLNITLGFRFDHIRATVPEMTKTAAVDELGKALSKAYILPAYGVDPFGGGFKWSALDNAFPYNFFSPSIGISYDPFGRAKTAFKLHYGRYAEGLPTWHISTPPSGNGSFQFRWWDTNGNGQPDAPFTDNYQYVPGSPLPNYMLKDDYKDTTDPNIKIPYEHQVIAGVDHELFRDFRVSLNYSYKQRRNEMVSVYYDRASGEYWSFNENYWVPFQTTVPAYKDFPAVPVTVYFMKAAHPEEFYRKTNLPNDMLKQRYHSIELSFNKRFSDGWSLGGSVVYTDLKGNLEYSGGSIQGAFRTPNYAINSYGDLNFSIPLMIKLYGSVFLPYGVNLSFFYEHLDGNGWARTVTVEAPLSWRQANGIYQFNTSNSVLLETVGTRRNQSSETFDLRLEKTFSLGRIGRLGVFLDVFNALGFHSFSANMNPAGTWRPTDVNATTGTYTPGILGFNGVTGGVRTYKFSLRYTF
ncbi:MAG: TonB-dependent receptor [Candidatus Aminicenantes bacterium]|nr:TonB-dependent receptor [Candidatus Aminicenantes bacterium]